MDIRDVHGTSDSSSDEVCSSTRSLDTLSLEQNSHIVDLLEQIRNEELE